MQTVLYFVIEQRIIIKIVTNNKNNDFYDFYNYVLLCYTKKSKNVCFYDQYNNNYYYKALHKLVELVFIHCNKHYRS